MAETTSLESQLIAGAGKAVAYDPEGVVQLAQEEAGQKLIEGVKGIVTKIGDIKAAVDAQNKGYETNWQDTVTKMNENLGSLDVDYFDKATNHVEEMKKTGYDLCASGKEGNRCRTKELIKLKQFSNHVSEVKDKITAHKELQEKIDAGDLDKSNYKDPRKIAILGSVDGMNSKLGGKNDAEIFEHEAEIDRLKSSKGMTRGGGNRTEEIANIQKKIDRLQKNNPQEYGWNISYINNQGEEINERVTLKDIDDLIPTRDNDIGNGYLNDVNTVKDDNANFIAGVKGSGAWNKRAGEQKAEAAINEKNLTSYWHDNHKFADPLIERIGEHPIFNGMTYSGLGITQVGEDDIIDPEERDRISTTDKQQMTNALSDPKNPNFNEDLSLELARDDYYNNLKKESEIDLYGTEYWNKDNLEYPVGTPHETFEDKQAAIKEFLTTPLPGESLTDFKEKGGIVGAAADKGITWNSETDSWNKPEYDVEGTLVKFHER